MGRRLLRGAIGGFLAGLVFIGVTMWFSDTLGNPAEMPLELISTLLLGKSALMDGSADATLGFFIHAVLSMIHGMVFALIVPRLSTNGTVALAGGVFGLVIYLVNFQVIGRLWFDQFVTGPNQAFEVVVHVVFGHLLAVAFYSSGVRSHEPFIDLTGAEGSTADSRRHDVVVGTPRS